jgi:hypothetical protein
MLLRVQLYGQTELEKVLFRLQPGRERDGESLDASVDLVDASDGGVDGREHPARLLVEAGPTGCSRLGGS